MSLKFFKTILFLFLFVNTNAQNFWEDLDTSGLRNYEDVINERYELLDTNNYPNGVLYNRSAGISKIKYMDGNFPDATINFSDWMSMYLETKSSMRKSNNLDSIQNLFNKITKTYTKNFASTEVPTIPIGILLYDYYQIRETTLDSNLITIINENQFDEVGNANVFTKKRYFAIAPLMETLYGDTAIFYIDPSFLFTNLDIENLEINVDFGDGQGLRPVTLGQEYKISYSSLRSGGPDPCPQIEIYFNLLITISDNSSFINVDEVEVATLLGHFCPDILEPYVDPDKVITYSTTSNLNQEIISAKIGVWYNCFTPGVLRKPIIYLTGFNPAHFNNIYTYYTIYNKNNLLEKLRNEGFDIIIATPENGVDFTVNNSQLFEMVLNDINSTKTINNNFHENILVGVSAGTFSTRSLLNKFEYDHLNSNFTLPFHNTRLYISYEGEHQGANIPLGDQHGIQSLIDEAPMSFTGDGVSSIVALLQYQLHNSDIAKELLFYHHTKTGILTNNSISFTQGNHQYRDDLLAHLSSFSHSHTKVDGFPGFTRNIAVANGSANNTRQNFDSGEILLELEKNSITFIPLFPFYKHKTRFQASDYGQNNVFNRFTGLYTLLGFTYIPIYQEQRWTGASRLIDNAPGGTFGFHGIISSLTKLAWGSEPDILVEESECFTPTISTLDIRNHNNFDYDYDVIANDLFWIRPNLQSPNHGYPHIKHPTDHLNYTTFDAVFAPKTNDKHVEDESPEMADFIFNESGPYDLKLQNRNIGEYLYNYKTEFEARNSIQIGKSVTFSTPENDFTIVPNASCETRAGYQILLKPGFKAESGCRFLARIEEFPCEPIFQERKPDEIPNTSEHSSIKLKESNFETENKFEIDLQLYPNPIDKGNLIYNTKEIISNITIYDISGKTILNIHNPITNSINIDFLDRGNYIISFIFTNHNIINKKLVKL